MTESTRPRSIVSTDATAVIRQRPAVLLMLVRVRAAGATLDLGLAEVRQLAADAVRRLTRLGAVRAWAGDPHPDDQANPDPLARMRAVAGRVPAKAPTHRPGVNVTVAATWDIAGLLADGVLTLVDQLQFDAAADASPSEPPEAPADPPWADPAQQIQRMLANAAEPPDDRAPKFVYIARPTEEQLAQAASEAYLVARHRAERLAGATGLRLGAVFSLNYGHPVGGGRPDRLMADQRCAALLASVGYVLGDGEIASEDPRAIELAVSVHVAHHLEG
ncbi:SIMPL domain-containing protein [Frigoriglobus tundricola]|uniref:Uncharacterized protein n=1 Tax=Frigoriglobus tundricola TaxID=2774151 RepID=A0A6M5YW83_9BACT|nr:SIMPL domain-containing protein [Frigoriglobus tundricola]QJW97760.1 hypothetical protein FTUN_5338 [Frigoriglobus tundricola]